MNHSFASPNQDIIAKARQKVQEQATKQGYKPAKAPEELIGDFWPDNESIDDLVQAVRTLRQAEI